MRYRMYGRTGKKVSVVGFGGMRFDHGRSDAENAELVRYACSKGINYFDTAPGYGRSEDIFGIAFKDMPGEYYVSTKAMPTEFDTAEKARTAVQRSLDRMKVPKIHFFHVWCLRKMAHFELAMQPGGMYDGLVKCREEGLIDHIVFSTHQPGNEVRQMLATNKYEGVLMGLNALNFPYRWEGVEAAAEMGLGVVAMNPLFGGAIPQHHKELAFLAGPGESPTEAALRFIIGCEDVTVSLVGFTTKEHVDAACRVADAAKPVTAEEIARIRKHLGVHMTKACTACGYCKDCPQEIPVAAYMQFYNEKALFGWGDGHMRKMISDQLNWMLLAARKADAGACVECGRCEEACTQHLPIIERLKEFAAWEAELKAKQAEEAKEKK